MWFPRDRTLFSAGFSRFLNFQISHPQLDNPNLLDRRAPPFGANFKAVRRHFNRHFNRQAIVVLSDKSSSVIILGLQLYFLDTLRKDTGVRAFGQLQLEVDCE